MGIELTDNAKKLLAHRGSTPSWAPGRCAETIQREIEDQLSEKILFGEIEAGQIVIVDVEGLDTSAEEGSNAWSDKAKFTFRGERKASEPVPDSPPTALAGEE
ncbi:hypothetical protein [Pseudonocardia sp. ICBG601]|uniref:hypothetical protein n=1 Tax=Pseudonocardia sp. ICBG601 TaxID=2846759 RepID=UPI0021F52FD0|nr:hypothetical protein [Pseudonocardia sp. ICBG601]